MNRLGRIGSLSVVVKADSMGCFDYPVASARYCYDKTNNKKRVKTE